MLPSVIFKRALFVGAMAFGIDAGATLKNQSGEYVWTFLSGLPWPGGYTQSTGKPLNLLWAKDEYSADFFTRISNALPESRVNSAFLTSDAGSNITLKEAGDVYVTFVHEGAGYLNSFGFFTFDKNNPPKTKEDVRETIIFPNLSYPHLASGHRLHLGYFPAGTSIGFFLAANGFSTASGVKKTAVPYYYSIKALNPDPTDALRQHNVLLVDGSTSEVILGFEDLPRQTGDNDFNDAVFSVKVTPSTALETSTLNLIPAKQDADSDGIADALDEFPNDFNRAYSTYFPSQQGWTTLAFEDNWPNVGDYDLNDLVLRERFQAIYSARGQITGFKISGYIDARGAANHNGFAVRLMNMDRVMVSSAKMTIAGNTNTLSAETKQANPVLLLWSDSHTYTTTQQSGACSHFNTVSTCPVLAPVPFELDVNLLTPITQLTHSQLDFFLYRTDFRGREIHFADYPPTDRFDVTQFGKFDDTSIPSLNRYYRNANNLPWALKIPGAWRHPREYIDIVWAYPDYETWVESSGTQAQEWHLNQTRIHHLF